MLNTRGKRRRPCRDQSPTCSGDTRLRFHPLRGRRAAERLPGRADAAPPTWSGHQQACHSLRGLLYEQACRQSASGEEGQHIANLLRGCGKHRCVGFRRLTAPSVARNLERQLPESLQSAMGGAEVTGGGDLLASNMHSHEETIGAIGQEVDQTVHTW